MAFSPDEALRPMVEESAARWSLATGCEVVVTELGESGGIPVRLVPVVLRPDGSEAPAVTSEARDLVEVNAHCSADQRSRTVPHELGHALGGDHTESDGVLSGGKVRRNVIDLPALESVCSRLPCGWLNPEG